ncbi:MAG TPA: phosphatidate cytidylyltransferase [Tepidiformaceae bacterium]|nr:phosphatidate cytidylyltransferase [Tepidiformaceae bacterium]
MARSNLQLRLLTAGVGLPLVAIVAWIGGWPFALVLAGIALLASAEFVHGWLIPSMPIRQVIGQGPAAAIPAVLIAGVHADPRFLWMGAAFAGVFAVLGYAPTNAFGPRKPFRVYCWLVLYLGILLSTLVLVRDLDDGREWFFLGLLSTFAVDTGAYAVGRAIGRHKMAPRISPKKTWEGAAGGVVAGTAAVFALNALFDTGVGAGTIWHLAVAVPPAAMIGDLFESWMKRRMGVKDASGLLPGHGGFMDRLDSVVAVFPVLYLFLQLRVL